MLYAIVSIIALLLIFIFVSYFLTYKNYSFQVEGSQLRVENRGAHLRIYINNLLCEDNYMPQLIKGEEYKLLINDKDVVLKVRSSALGYKMRIEVIVDDQVVADNGVKLKERKVKENKDTNDTNKSNACEEEKND